MCVFIEVCVCFSECLHRQNDNSSRLVSSMYTHRGRATKMTFSNKPITTTHSRISKQKAARQWLEVHLGSEIFINIILPTSIRMNPNLIREPGRMMSLIIGSWHTGHNRYQPNHIANPGSPPHYQQPLSGQYSLKYL